MSKSRGIYLKPAPILSFVVLFSGGAGYVTVALQWDLTLLRGRKLPVLPQHASKRPTLIQAHNLGRGGQTFGDYLNSN